MSTALCKNRYFKDLIKQRRVCFGMTKKMVEASWGTPWRKYDWPVGEEVWEWGSQPHSKVKFDTDGIANHVYSVASTGKDGWSR